MAVTVWTKREGCSWHPAYSDDTRSEAIDRMAERFRDEGLEVRVERNNWDLAAEGRAADASERRLREFGG